MESSAICERKQTLRRSARSVLAALTVAQRLRASREIARTIAQIMDERQPRMVLAYSPLPSEPDWMLEQAWDLSRFAWPRIESGEQLGFYRILDGADLQPGALGILEPPPETSRRVQPVEADWALVPGLAFDAAGGRLGRGRGCYDRMLAAANPEIFSIGVAFGVQVVPAVPAGPNDMRVRALATESGFHRCG